MRTLGLVPLSSISVAPPRYGIRGLNFLPSNSSLESPLKLEVFPSIKCAIIELRLRIIIKLKIPLWRIGEDEKIGDLG
ncbi:hypothetical protein Nepgr_017799 [Nepenthes gracilis]|uniref:Uncharacterized protein n=1 Tax=Nepenthes gracilis TaxID=150966 RepID=A0AAD3XSU1_NEPGR|nr:hypothetical protein Nepgr_017799 [Nepenthes gracilis]